jgi:D-inositol-3-phosphate glycosyltransferase
MSASDVVRRVGLLSVHTSPTDLPGEGDGGGLNVYVLQSATRLAARGLEVDVFTRRTSHDEPATEEVAPGVLVHRVRGGPVAPLPKHDVVSNLCSFVMEMERHPRAATMDVLHAHYWLSGWAGHRLARRWNVPLVQTFHTIGAMKNASLAPGDLPEAPLRLVAEQRIAEQADRLAVLTCGEARLLHRTFGVSGSRIDVVPAGVDLDRFSPVPAADDPTPAGPVLLFVGRLQPLKGPDVAVRTLAAVRRDVPGARLVVIGGTSGSGDGRTGPVELRRLAASLGVEDAVELRDAMPQAELAGWYRAADVVVAPSRSETFGLVALEAQACGTPVVAADVPGLRATVRGGVLVPGHEPADHAAAVVDVLRRPARHAELVQRGLEHAAATSWDATVDRLTQVYGDVVGARAVPAV